jgi:hypothetical protein
MPCLAFGQRRQRRRHGVIFLLEGVVEDLRFSPSWGCGSPGEIPSFGLPKRALASDASLPPWRHRLGGSICGCLLVFLMSTV